MSKPEFYHTHSAHSGKAKGASIRSCKGDVVKLALTVIGVLCMLGIAGKAWVWNDKPQVTLPEEQASWSGNEIETMSTEIAHTFLPGRGDRHDRIHRDFFVLSNTVSRDVNETRLSELN